MEIKFRNPWDFGGNLYPSWETTSYVFEELYTKKTIGGVILFNDSPKSIYYLTEDSCEVFEIKAKTRKIRINADGVATMYSKTEVFKIPDFTEIFITESGEVQYTAQSNLLAITLGGWKDKYWLQNLDTWSQKCWGKLFEKAFKQF